MKKTLLILATAITVCACEKTEEKPLRLKYPGLSYTDSTIYIKSPSKSVWWDKKNIEGYYTYSEALALAKKHGKRLPTSEDLIALRIGYCEFDEDLKGLWATAYNISTSPNWEDLKNPNVSLFFPANGVYAYLDSTMNILNKDSMGRYWLESTPIEISPNRRLCETMEFGGWIGTGSMDTSFRMSVRLIAK